MPAEAVDPWRGVPRIVSMIDPEYQTESTVVTVPFHQLQTGVLVLSSWCNSLFTARINEANAVSTLATVRLPLRLLGVPQGMISNTTPAP